MGWVFRKVVLSINAHLSPYHTKAPVLARQLYPLCHVPLLTWASATLVCANVDSRWPVKAASQQNVTRESLLVGMLPRVKSMELKSG